MKLKLKQYWKNLQQLFIPRNHNIAGLDINSDFIKLLKINSNVTPYKIENMISMPLPKGAMIKEQLRDIPLITKKVKEAFKQSGLTTNNIAMAVPRSWTITKNMIVNAHMTPDEIESRVWIEADRHFSNLIGEIYLDFTVTGPAKNDPSQLELMLVATRKDQINPYLEVMKMADLNVKIMDVNCYALERALFMTIQPLLQSQTIGLLNLDYSMMSLLVMENNHLIYANDQAYEGHHLLNPLFSPVKQLELAEGEDKPIELAENAENTTADGSGKQGFISYLKHMMQFYYSNRSKVKINQMLLSGDCATMPNLSHLIQEEIGIETKILNPLQNMKINHDVDPEIIKKEGPAFTLCCGLALSEVK